MALIARTLKRYASNSESTTVRWRGRVEILLDSDWLFTTECSVIKRNDGKGLFVAGSERKMPDGTYFKIIRFSEDLQQAIITAVRNEPDPLPRIDDPQKSIDRRESGKANSNSMPDPDFDTL